MIYLYTLKHLNIKVFWCECGANHEISSAAFIIPGFKSMKCRCGKMYGLEDYRQAFNNREGDEKFVDPPEYDD